MSDTLTKIKSDWMNARKARDKLKASLLGTLVGGIMTKEKTFSPARPVTEAEVVSEVKKMLASLVETGRLIADHADRAEQIADNATEQRVLEAYLPKQMSEADLEAFVVERKSLSMGEIMAALKAAHPGQYDGKLASTVTKRVLSEAGGAGRNLT
jgi:uncharacterized protein YqeY